LRCACVEEQRSSHNGGEAYLALQSNGRFGAHSERIKRAEA
jgi:hypothetical protein